ncbi:MAG: transglycosylase SLT domain-containing protein [Desulfuromonadaceae bacterium]|nr:transglycosylase SLT domain-containing protein [Desulfuromonadaceae bacterium]MDD5106306.1 transglycosylase SLT domain-containing protein [Desulfuromonadaceae bacterium]
MSHIFRPVLTAFASAALLTGTVLSTPADVFLTRAADRYRDKDFMGAYSSAQRSTDEMYRPFVHGMAALRVDKFEEALILLSGTERTVPLIADYAAFFQAEALFKLKRYPAAATKAASIRQLFPTSKLLRRSDKLYADSLYGSGDFKAALKSYQSFIEKYPSGSDAVDASFQSALCREETADGAGALLVYRSIWLNSPASPLAAKAEDRIGQLAQSGLKPPAYSADELLKRASALYAHSRYTATLKTLEMIPTVLHTPAVTGRIDLRSGMANYRLKRYKQAENLFAGVATSPLPAVRSEARLWLAKSLDRQNLKERALVLYLELAGEGKKQELADDALIEAAGVKRSLAQYHDAALLFEQALKLASDAKAVTNLMWQAGWCRYLAGDYSGATDAFKGLLANETYREKALYWLGRAQEKSAPAAAESFFTVLLQEFPAGFYASWYREQKGLRDVREPFGTRDTLAELPQAAGYEKPRLLGYLGLFEEARSEMESLRKKNSEKNGQFPALARVYLEMRDYGSAISLFMQNRPIPWEKGTLPQWTAGYPRAYTELVCQNAALNGLSEGLVFALIRAESGFAPAVKSGAGAIGLMQMMPATAKMTAREKGDFDPQRLTVPEYNIRLGTKHLKDLMKEHDGDVIYMAAAYNAGTGAVERWKKRFKGMDKDEFIENIPYQETRDYVKKVYASAATYRQLYGMK